MAKRSGTKAMSFERKERDFYPTPYRAVVPLIDHLMPGVSFIEPCAGDGALIAHLQKHGHTCAFASDIVPQTPKAVRLNAFDLNECAGDYIITNPPWARSVLHEMIEHFRGLAPSWLLFDADWMHTKQAIPYLKYCHRIVSVGRVSWMGNQQTGMDNCAWYLFKKRPPIVSHFYPRKVGAA